VAAFFEACIADSGARHATLRDGAYLHFVCAGAPARAFYERLGRLAPDKTFVETREARTWRYTTKPKKDTVGLDFCVEDRSAAEPAYSCTLIYPAGPILGSDQ
jgi:hypothetical protein